MLKKHGVEIIPLVYKYEEKLGALAAAAQLKLDEHKVVKTLVMEDEKKAPLIIIMHGDREVSTKALARSIGVKTVSPCAPAVAQKHTGCMVGGTSPFGTNKTLPVYVESSILNLDKIFINAGKRGLLVEITPRDLVKILNPRPVEASR